MGSAHPLKHVLPALLGTDAHSLFNPRQIRHQGRKSHTTVQILDSSRGLPFILQELLFTLQILLSRINLYLYTNE